MFRYRIPGTVISQAALFCVAIYSIKPLFILIEESVKIELTDNDFRDLSTCHLLQRNLLYVSWWVLVRACVLVLPLRERKTLPPKKTATIFRVKGSFKSGLYLYRIPIFISNFWLCVRHLSQKRRLNCDSFTSAICAKCAINWHEKPNKRSGYHWPSFEIFDFFNIFFSTRTTDVI